MKVLSPADAYETEKMVKAMAEIPGPCYIRLNRNDVPTVTQPDEPFELGKSKLMLEGSDVVAYATGYMVHLALEAAELLQSEGISLRVVNVHTIKPLDTDGVLSYAKGMKGAVTIEEASILGGLGSAVCETLSEGPSESRIPMLRMGIQDVFGTSAANYDELLDAYHLTSSDIVQKVKDVISLA